MDVDVREQLLQPEGRTARNVNVNVFDSGAPYSSSDDDSDSDGDETALGKDGSGVPLTQTVAPVQEESAENRVAGAAIYLYEGLRYLKFAFHPRTPAQLRAFRRLHQSPYSIVYRLELATAIIFMMLALIERPAAVYVQPWVVMIIELLCVAFFTWDIVMRVRVRCEDKGNNYYGRRTRRGLEFGRKGLSFLRQVTQPYSLSPASCLTSTLFSPRLLFTGPAHFPSLLLPTDRLSASALSRLLLSPLLSPCPSAFRLPLLSLSSSDRLTCSAVPFCLPWRLLTLSIRLAAPSHRSAAECLAG